MQLKFFENLNSVLATYVSGCGQNHECTQDCCMCAVCQQDLVYDYTM